MSSKPLNIFTQHSRHWRDNRYVYPVVSRRSKGLSIGINLNPDKVCNFDCIYCCVDRRSMPGRVEVNLDDLRGELESMLATVAGGSLWKEPPFDQTPEELRRLNDIAFSGDGEPTSYQKFEEVCQLAARSLEQPALKGVKLVVITNATLLHQARVQSALIFLDAHNGELWAKLDAGTESYYQLVERTAVPFQRVLDNILAAGRLRPIVIQSLFMNIHGQPPPPPEVEAYLARLSHLHSQGCRIKLVQIYTTARNTTEAYVTPLGLSQLQQIAAGVKQLGLAVDTYAGVA
ncbi:MAG TPA: radical SAM protein [Tepidisphaeraceae bacterium]|nr:radical SAM protein [Tepidisphaeraceae bacterium]